MEVCKSRDQYLKNYLLLFCFLTAEVVQTGSQLQNSRHLEVLKKEAQWHSQVLKWAGVQIGLMKTSSRFQTNLINRWSVLKELLGKTTYNITTRWREFLKKNPYQLVVKLSGRHNGASRNIWWPSKCEPCSLPLFTGETLRKLVVWQNCDLITRM